MATTYRISGTPHATERDMHNRKAAITEADNRARYAKYAVAVTVTTVATGKVVHTVPARNTPALCTTCGSPQGHCPNTCTEAIKEEMNTTRPVTEDKPETPQPKPEQGKQYRAPLGAASMPGWDVLYDKPRAGYQVWRSTSGAGYALWCTKHEHCHQVPTLAAERAARQVGHWCPGCETPTDLGFSGGVHAMHTRKSIPTRLQEAGITWEQTMDSTGMMKFVIDGKPMTPGEAAERYLS